MTALGDDRVRPGRDQLRSSQEMEGSDPDHRFQHPRHRALDPFSYVKPQEAAAILADFILTFYSGVLGLTNGPDSYGH